MNNKILLVFAMAFLFVGLVSAGVEFVEGEGEYGKYVIDTWVPDWLGGEGTSEIKLIQNTDQCLIDCSFTLEGTNEQPVNLIDDIKFVNKEGKDVKDNLKEITFYLGKYEEVEKINYSKPIYSTEEVCTEPNLNETNSSNFTQSCYYPVVDYETYNIDELVWTEYNGEKVEGYFQLKAEAKKEKISMDWIVEFRGRELSSWEWWNSDWQYKRQIDLTADVGKISYLYEINYSANMNEDYSDIRFINNAEDTEFNYTIQTYNSTRAVVRIYSQGENSFWLYYGNSEASSTSQTAGVFHFNPVSMYYLDETSGSVLDAVGTNNGTNFGATPNVAGKIGTAYDFDGTNDYIVKTSPTGLPTGSNSFSVSQWIYREGNSFSSDGGGIYQWGIDDTKKQNGVFITNNNYSISNQRNKFIHYFYASDLVSNSNVSLNTWEYWTVTWDGTTRRIYKNGVLDNSDTPTGINVLGSDLFISRVSAPIFRYFNGKIDEFVIYNRSLTADEIALLYNYTAPTYTIGEEQIEGGFITIDYVTPPTPENNSNLSVNYIPVEVEINYTNATLDNITYDFYKGGELDQSYFFTNETLFVNHTSCQCDNWAFNVTTCYTEQISDTSNCTTTETRYLIIDSQPPVINITSPLTTYDYLYDNYILDLNWSVEDEAGHLDSCWYEYNGTNNSVTCNDNTTTFNYSVNVNNLTFYANDTFGNVGSEFRGWNYMVLEEGVLFEDTAVETSTQEYYLNFSYSTNITSFNSVFYYDNSSYDPEIIDLGENKYTLKNTIDVPLQNGDSNKSFYWSFDFTLLNSSTLSINSTIFLQEVTRIIFTNCNVTYPTQFINFTTKSTKNPFPNVNATFKSSWEWYLGSGEVKKNYSFEDLTETKSSWAFCTNYNDTFIVDAQIEYDSSEYTLNNYYLINASLTNDTSYIDLYTLNQSESTVTVLKVRDSIQNPVGDVLIQIQQYDVGTDSFYLVGMGKTSFNGEEIAYLNWYDTLYRFILIKDGVVIKSTNTTRIAESPIIFDIIEGQTFSFEKFRDFEYSLTFNNLTNNYVLSYTKPNGLVEQGCLRVIKRTSLDDTLICDSCSSSASSTLYCNIGGYGNGTYIGTFYATGSWYLLDSLVHNVGGSFSETIYDLLDKNDSAFYSFLLSGIILSMFIINPILGIIGIILALLASSAFGFIQISYTVFAGIIIGGILIVWIIKR